MPQPALTDAQRSLLSYINEKKIHEGPKIESGAFAKLMLQPKYVELVRKDIKRPGNWDQPGDSAAFYDMFRSETGRQPYLDNEDVKEPAVSSSREGRYDTLRYPAVGDIPARTRVEFRPSLGQRASDKFDEASDMASSLLDRVRSGFGMPDKKDVTDFIGGLTPAARSVQMSPKAGTPKAGVLDEFLAALLAPKLDAVSGAAKKPTKLQRDGL